MLENHRSWVVPWHYSRLDELVIRRVAYCCRDCTAAVIHTSVSWFVILSGESLLLYAVFHELASNCCWCWIVLGTYVGTATWFVQDLDYVTFFSLLSCWITYCYRAFHSFTCNVCVPLQRLDGRRIQVSISKFRSFDVDPFRRALSLSRRCVHVLCHMLCEVYILWLTYVCFRDFSGSVKTWVLAVYALRNLGLWSYLCLFQGFFF